MGNKLRLKALFLRVTPLRTQWLPLLGKERPAESVHTLLSRSAFERKKSDRLPSSKMRYFARGYSLAVVTNCLRSGSQTVVRGSDHFGGHPRIHFCNGYFLKFTIFFLIKGIKLC
jgi:hypothetical protein